MLLAIDWAVLAMSQVLCFIYLRGVQTKYTHASFFQKIIKLNQTFFYSTI
ncbi:hypothetical protein BMWSH_3211 [Priestia megaterium WSH-002]|uniref:Uncharacterized protein n=1 Tax=Priestia megaterium (strain WSH-002) TaxID=1006007 RepID=A0A8D4BNY5_PRIMW|nr:hypothetical protein BMWSH_3211 [Priestia megaterium WSH-002]